VKKPLPIENYTDKNFTLLSETEINSSNKPLALKDIEIKGTNKLETKIASDLSISSHAYYSDDDLPGEGPIPPEVGESTTYTIKWRLVNTSNDLSSVEVESSLPPQVEWKDRVKPQDADLKYEENSGNLVWQVGDLASGTGVLSPVKEVSFQVSITPNSSQVGEILKLLNQVKALGEDDFTNQKTGDTAREIDTILENDTDVDDNGRVVE
jgi:hypothetical protein